MCVHLAHELAVHGWVAPCVRRGGAGQRASATQRDAARRGRQFPLTSSTSIRRFHDSVADDEKTDDLSTSTVTVKCSSSRMLREYFLPGGAGRRGI